MTTEAAANDTITATAPPTASLPSATAIAPPQGVALGVKGMRESLGSVRSAMIAGGIDEAKVEQMLAPSVAVAEKCEAEVVAWRPYGGAMDFGGIDSYLEANKRSAQIDELAYQFNQIVANIMSANPEEVSLTEKASRVAAAAGDLQSRVGQVDASIKEKKNGSLLDRVGGAFRSLLPGTKDYGDDELGLDFVDAPGGTLRAFKDDAGVWRWTGIWSNAYKDDEGEVFPLEAHQEFIGWCDKSGRYPELWSWHTPGSRMGVADMLDIHAGFTIATGTFDKGMEDCAERLSQMPDIGMSHGYLYRLADKATGKYSIYRAYEISELPAHRAGNKLTGFAPLREAMTMDATKEKHLRATLGDARVDAMKSNLEQAQKELTAAGIGMSIKEAADVLTAPAPPAVATAAAPAPDAAATAAPPAPAVAATLPATANAEAAAAGNQASLPPPAPSPATASGADVPAIAGTGADDKAFTSALVSALGAQIESAVAAATKEQGEQLTAIQSTLSQYGEQLIALKESDDAKITAAFAPRAQQAAASAVKDDGNVVTDEKKIAAVEQAAKAADDAPLAAVSPYMEQLKGLPALAGGGT